MALAIELFTDGSLNTFAKPTNVDTNARILCYDIRDLGCLLYTSSEVNRKIRAEREKLKLCREICRQTPVMEQDIQKTEEHQKEVREHEHRRR